MIDELFNRAVSLHRAGRLGEAEGLYRQALGIRRDDPKILYWHAMVLFHLQRLPESLETTGAALALAPEAQEILELQGALLQTLGRPAEALAVLTRAATVAPGSFDAWYNTGVVLGDLERPSEAVAAFDKALALQSSPLAWNGRAAALRRLGRANEALVSVDKALAGPHQLPAALWNRALILWDLNQLEAALQAFDRLVTVDPGAVDAWAQRAKVLAQLGRLAEALESAGKALERRPDHPAAWAVCGQTHLRLSRFAEALASFDRSLEAAPDQEDVHCARGEALLGLDRPAEALEVLQAVLVRNPDSAEALARRATALAGLRQFEAATADFEAALRIAPTRGDIWFNSASPLIALQRFDEALAALDRTLALDPAHPVAKIRRGEVLCESGRIAEGMEQIARWAQQAYAEGASPIEEPVRSPEAKQRHDEEQRAWLAARRVGVIRGLHIDGGDRIGGPAVNLANHQTVAGQWAASDPKMVVIDQLLTPPALEGLRRFCWGSTVWRRSYRQGYLGAFPQHGFACPLLAQIAEELREVFPTLIGGHGLLLSWGFKYDSRLGGILTHADPAAINVNFWITPDEANLDPESGGMVVWDAVPPPEWEFRQANSDNEAIEAFLEGAGAVATTVPYRENRAVIFDSNLFHKTDRIDFREGYENRRINVTMLYGRRNAFNF